MERVYFNGYTTCYYGDGSNATFKSCNFGIKAIDAVRCETVSDTIFESCNFECDNRISGANYSSLLYLTTQAVFIGCSFVTDVDSNIAVIRGGTSGQYVFIGNRLRQKTGDSLSKFFSESTASAKYSIVFAGGNDSIMRPVPYSARSLQVLDLERSTLPKKTATSEEGTNYAGEIQYDSEDKTGHRPVWYNGSGWSGIAAGTWEFLDGITSGSSATYTVSELSDRPRLCIFSVRGHTYDVYSVGIVSVYRGAALATYTSLAANKISVSFNNTVGTITNNDAATQYMYVSVIDLM